MTPRTSLPSEAPHDEPRSTARERSLSGHIFAVSAGLVGVCLTVIGLFSIVHLPGENQGRADDLIALDATVFLFACLFAYLALRTREERHWLRLERCADALFLVGLSGMVIIGVLVASELI